MTLALWALTLPLLAASPPLTQDAPWSVKSTGMMALKVAGEFSIATPDSSLKYRLDGPGKAVVTVAPVLRPGLEQTTLTVEVISAGATMKKETVTVDLFPRLEALDSPRPFTPFGFKRISIRLPPKSAVYEVKVSGEAAVAVSKPVRSASGAELDMPAVPENKVPTFALGSKEQWHWGSVCNSVRVTVREPGVLHVQGRMQLQSVADLPPPSFMRVLFNQKVKAAVPIAGAPDTGLEFTSGKSRYPVGTPKKVEVPVLEKGDYDIELAAWGCVNGVGLEIVFEPGAKMAPKVAARESTSPTVQMSGAASAIGQQATPAASEAMAQCNLLMEDTTRARVLEYLDTMVASGIIPGSRLAMKQDYQLGDTFAVESITYTVDDKELLRRDNPLKGPTFLGERELLPGPHIFDVLIVLRGRGSGQFQHLNDYVFRVNKRESFIAEAGKKYEARVGFKDRGGFTSALKDRPYVELDIAALEAP